MSIWSTITQWCNAPTRPTTLRWIERNNVRPAYEEVPIKADETYVRISLVEMVLGNGQKWFTAVQPTVQALDAVPVRQPGRGAAEPRGRRASATTPRTAPCCRTTGSWIWSRSAATRSRCRPR